jgi:hypothetical protein
MPFAFRVIAFNEYAPVAYKSKRRATKPPLPGEKRTRKAVKRERRQKERS